MADAGLSFNSHPDLQKHEKLSHHQSLRGKNPPKNLNQTKRTAKTNAKLVRKGFNTV